MSRKPYSIYRRHDWLPITIAVAGLVIAACAVAVGMLAWAGVPLR